MEKFKKSVRLKNRILKIILSSVIAIAMASFYMIGISAASYRPVSFNIVSWADNINTSLLYSYSTDNIMQLSSLGSDPSEDYRVNSPYRVSGIFDTNSFYFPGVCFFDSQGVRKNIVFNLYFGFQYYFDNLDFSFYMILPENFYRSLSVSYLDSDNQFVYGNVNITALKFDTLSSLFSNDTYGSYFSQAYKDYVNFGSSYYTDASGVTYNDNHTSVKFYIARVDISFSDLNKTPINFLSIYLNFNTTSNVVDYPYLKPYIYFPNPNLEAYILQSDTDTYTEILAQQQQLIDQVENITGDVPSGMQSELDSDQAAQDQKLEELNENLITINEPTMPPEAELPTAPLDPEEAEEVYEDINTVFNLDGLNLFNILVPTGCVGFLIFTVMRRF